MVSLVRMFSGRKKECTVLHEIELQILKHEQGEKRYDVWHEVHYGPDKVQQINDDSSPRRGIHSQITRKTLHSVWSAYRNRPCKA